MQLMLVSLVSCLTLARSCLQCDSKIRLLNEDLGLSAPTVTEQIEIQMICDHAYETYRETSLERMGVIDPTTLYRARTEYQSEFDHFLKTEHTGSLAFEAIQIMEKGRKILEKHLDIFIRDGLCPNLCGLLKQRVIDCVSCQYQTYICPSPSGQQDCGEYPVQAEEGGQAVLNCFLPWHRLLVGKPEYHYSWAPGLPRTKKLNESEFRPLVVTDDSSVILNQLHVDEQGIYRCSLQENETIFYQVMFLLTVTALPDQTHHPHISLPTPPHGEKYSPFQHTGGLLLPLVALVTALSLAASLVITLILGIVMVQQRAAKESKRRRHKQRTQNMI